MLPEKNKLILGLDIGVTSVGWALINKDKDRIEDLGVRIFEIAEVPKTGGSLNKIRRDKRSTRRLLRRRKQRLHSIKNIFIEEGLLSGAEIEKILEKKNNPYELRVKGLDQELTPTGLFAALYHIGKKRGYKSNRKEKALENLLKNEDEQDVETKKELTKVKNAETGKVLKALTEMEEMMKKSSSRTVGEFLFKTLFKVSEAGFYEMIPNVKIRNSSGSYSYTFTREQYQKEYDLILEKQVSLGVLSEEVGEKIKKKIFFQRPFAKEGQIEKMVGMCQFEKAELRAPKSSITFQEFVAWQNIHNNTKIKDTENGDRTLTLEEKQKVFSKCFALAKVTYFQIRRELNLPETSVFACLSYKNKKDKALEGSALVKEIENKTFFEAKDFNKLKKVLNLEYTNLSPEHKNDLDEIARILTSEKEEDICIKKLSLLFQNSSLRISQEEIQKLSGIQFDSYGHLSLKAMRKILPYLEKGFLYTESCEELAKTDEKYKMWGSKSERKNKLPLIPLDDKSITSPVVKRAITQTRKVVNAIIDKYGELFEVHIELARDISKDRDSRNKIEKLQKENEDFNLRVVEQMKSELGKEVDKRDLLKYKLYKQQDAKCLYSGRKIELERLHTDGYVEIDHVIPFSRSGDDSLTNKVLVLRSENQTKGNRTPYEWFGEDEKKWNEYQGRVEVFFSNNLLKKQKLLTKKYSGEGMKERMLNDTRHATKYLKNYIENNLIFSDTEMPERNRKKVIVVNGQTTAYLRKRFGLRKVREDGAGHHALDAVMVAIATDGYIQKIASWEKAKTIYREFNIWKNYTDKDTGKPYGEDSDIIDFMSQSERFKKQLPDPWKNFKREVEIRLQKEINATDKKELQEKNISYSGSFLENQVKPIFISRMPRRTVNGPLHDDTLKSLKYIKQGENKTFKSVPLKDLKEKDLENSPVKETDKYLYDILKKLLIDNNKDLSKYDFEKNPVQKGIKETSPLVKSIKVYEDGHNSFIEINEGKASADNGNMVRVDIFEKENKKGKKQFFARLWYSYHIIAKKEPTKLCLASKQEKEWLTLDESYTFKFSLFKNDLIYIKDEAKEKEGFYYYNGFHRGANNLNIFVHDDAQKNILALAIQNLDILEKYHVGILGNYFKIKS